MDYHSEKRLVGAFDTVLAKNHPWLSHLINDYGTGLVNPNCVGASCAAVGLVTQYSASVVRSESAGLLG